MKVAMYLVSLLVVTVAVILLSTYGIGPETADVSIVKKLGLWIVFWATVEFNGYAKNKMRDIL